MDKKPDSPGSLQTHFVDIHEALPEEEEGDEAVAEKPKKRIHRPLRMRDQMKRNHRSFSRQVSLETGFSVLNGESKARDERSLLRSGRSFGGFDSANRIGIEGRKGDFSIFKTKSSLSKQNSLLPSRNDQKEMETHRNEGSEGLDESVNKSVPAGRYFAALRGPELDQVKVIYK